MKKYSLLENIHIQEVFGELSKRWEFCDIDLVEMDIINVVDDIGLNEEPVLIVNPIIRYSFNLSKCYFYIITGV